MTHLKSIRLEPGRYPTREAYPFHLPVFQKSDPLLFDTPVTFFAGENGSGKSTLLEAVSRHCGIYIWGENDGRRIYRNKYEKDLFRCLSAEWRDGRTPGAFFSSQIFHRFSEILEEWAVDDPGILDYFGGRSLLTQSHGQSLMAYFRNRFRIPGLYLMDEPETALSPTTQIELLRLLILLGKQGHAQFIIASHSPVLLACPDATIYSFDGPEIRMVPYEETDYYRVYRAFMTERERFLG
ncbi:MAG TPA: AAA family ATPase [bacterium]|nr:AAA family ATPase [bacterium]